MDEFSNELIEDLVAVGTYRDFLQAVFEKKAYNPKPITIAELSRRAGFSSRSFLSAVLKGRRGLSSRSFTKIVKGLKLTGDLRDLFYFLVCLDNSDVNQEGASQEELLTNLHKTRHRLEHQVREGDKDTANFLYRIKSAPFIYAALGECDEGATFSEIKHRTGLTDELLRNSLAKMSACGFVTFDRSTERYLAIDMQVTMVKIGASPFFRGFYLDELDRLKKRTRQNFLSEDELFYHATVSIDEEKVPQFRRELKGLLDRYVDQIENPNGSKVISLLTGLYF